MQKVRIFVIAAALLGAACAKRSLIEERRRTHAPTAAGDVGLLIEEAGVDEVERLLQQHPSAQVRTLNQSHGMYELFGVSRNDAQGTTGLPVHENSFFALQRQENQTLSLLSQPAPVGLQIGRLKPFAAGAEIPIARLDALEPGANLDGTSIPIGYKVKVSGSRSESSVGSKKWNSALYIVSPQAAITPEMTVDAREFEFKPEALGLYMVFVVVQDENDVCAVDGIRFIVTANRPYGGPVPEPAPELGKFSHLDQVSAASSWQIAQGEGILIAVVDTGVNYNHPSLASALEQNTREIPGNGVDDDGNGLVDDVLGYDFVNSDPYPYDDDGHGTHVAGVALGRPFGLARRARLLAIKALTGAGGDVGSIAASIRYAVDRGARIINMSLGGSAPEPHPALMRAVQYAESKGVLVVAAAGNGDAFGLGMDIDQVPTYPASLANSNLLTVASFDRDNVLSVYSNFGKSGVDVVAPGGLSGKDPVLSAAYENPRKALFVGMVGTSMATPVVAGIAAQVWSLNARLSLSQVKDIVMTSGKEFAELKSVTVSGRHVNALGALEKAMNLNVLF